MGQFGVTNTNSVGQCGANTYTGLTNINRTYTISVTVGARSLRLLTLFIVLLFDVGQLVSIVTQ